MNFRRKYFIFPLLNLRFIKFVLRKLFCVTGPSSVSFFFFFYTRNMDFKLSETNRGNKSLIFDDFMYTFRYSGVQIAKA